MLKMGDNGRYKRVPRSIFDLAEEIGYTSELENIIGGVKHVADLLSTTNEWTQLWGTWLNAHVNGALWDTGSWGADGSGVSVPAVVPAAVKEEEDIPY